MAELTTLGAMIDGGYTLAATCNECPNYVELDLPALALKLGRDHGSMHSELVPKLRCSCRGSENVGLRLSSPDARKSTYPGMVRN